MFLEAVPWGPSMTDLRPRMRSQKVRVDLLKAGSERLACMNLHHAIHSDLLISVQQGCRTDFALACIKT